MDGLLVMRFKFVMNKKKKFEFTDESAENSISFEYDDEIEEEMDVTLENGIPVLSANSQALLALAKIFIKMAICDYKEGFHLHLPKDFDADEPEVIRCFLKK